MFRPKTRLAMLWVAVALDLAGCGGGGDGASTPSNVTSFPVQQAVEYAYTHGLRQTFGVTGTASNGSTVFPVSGAVDYVLSAATSTTLNGAPALRSNSTVTGSLSVNSQTVPLNSTTVTYLDSKYRAMINTDGSNGSYCVATTTTSYPTNATPGMSGELGSFNCYTDSTQSTSAGTETINYTTSTGVNNTLNLQVIENWYGTSHQLIATGQVIYAVTTAGVPTIEQVSMSMAQNGLTLNITLNAQ